MRATPDDILGMAYFARVVETRSFTEAAKTLGVSKSVVSARVAKLEQTFGVQLLHRTTRRLALTADGVRLYERCARVVTEADEAAEIGAGASANPRGTLRVHAPSSIGQAQLTTAIGSFMQAHPNVRVDLRLSDRTPELEEIDVAIVVVERLADSGLTTRKLATTRMVVCATPAYLRRKGIPWRPQDLVLHDCIADLHFETEEGVVSMASLSKLVIDDARLLREATLAGLGIAMLPEALVLEDLAAGRLCRMLEDFKTGERAIHALHAHGRLPSASVRALLEHLSEAFRTRERAPAPVARRTNKRGIPMTEQDVRRLTSVASLYASDPGSAPLQALVDNAKVLPVAKIPRTAVTMNSRIRVRDAAENERELWLAYPWDAAGAGAVSVLSPLGRQLLGAAVGTKVLDGKKPLAIAGLPYQPEAAGDHHL